MFIQLFVSQILALLARNVEANMHLVSDRNAATPTTNYSGGDTHKEEGFGEGGRSLWCPVKVRKLDWLMPPWEEGTQIDEVCDEINDQLQVANFLCYY